MKPTLLTNFLVYSVVNYMNIVVIRPPEFFILHDCKSILIEQQLPISPSPKPLATRILLPAAKSLTTLDTAYKWKHAVFVLCEWLTSLSIISSKFIHTTAYSKISFFLKAE